MTIVQKLGDDWQVVISEAVAILPLIAILEAADDNDVIHGAFVGGISPDRGLDAPMTDRVNGTVFLGLKRDGVPLSLRRCASHRDLLSGLEDRKAIR
jgi:hypothetical protein